MATLPPSQFSLSRFPLRINAAEEVKEPVPKQAVKLQGDTFTRSSHPSGNAVGTPQMPDLPAPPETLAPWLFFEPKDKKESAQNSNPSQDQTSSSSTSRNPTNGSSGMTAPQQEDAPNQDNSDAQAQQSQNQEPSQDSGSSPAFQQKESAQDQASSPETAMPGGLSSGPPPDDAMSEETSDLGNNASPLPDEGAPTGQKEEKGASEVGKPPAAPLPSDPPPEAEPEPELPPLPVPTTPPPTIRGFDDNVIRTLNIRLEDPDWMRRTDASNDFYIILGANPNLEKRKQYKKYVDAFALKIMRDPSAVVHEPMLRAMQVGYYRYPSKPVLAELQRLRNSAGMLGLEAQIVDDAIYGIQKAQHQDALDAKQAKEDKQNEQQEQQGGKANQG